MKDLGYIFMIFGFVGLISLAIKRDHQEKERYDVELNLAKYYQIERRSPGDNKKQRFALLVNGSYEKRHASNIEMAFDLFIDYGLDKSHIFILDDYKGSKTPYLVIGRPEKISLFAIVSHLKKKLSPNDLLFVYVTGHGSLINFEDARKQKTFISFARGIMSEEEFFSFFRDLPATMVFLFDHCYGGNFSQTMCKMKQECVSISASQAWQKSKGNSFPQAFFGAFRSPNADLDKNSMVDMGEAFSFAVARDPNAQNGLQQPAYYTNTTRKIFLN